MSFVSYAQNFEDVMLWRALKLVENGFYIDVGANDPNVDSVTRAFYERGWRGINIEPLISHHRDLERERPNDINLCCAAGAQNGELELWECDIRGWATVSNTVVEQHKKEGHEGIFHKVPVIPLSDICAKYVTDEIHFLKIDVEGFEKSVIEGMDFSLFRPWVLVVEATQPNSTEEVYEEWSDTLLAADYVFAYADGLNRFYVSREHSEILTSFRYPPNVFDDFIRSEQLNSELRAQQAQEHAAFAEAQSQQIDQKCIWLETEWDAAKQRIEEFSKSTGKLEAELAAEQTKAINLALELNAVNEHNTQLKTHTQGLQNELDADKQRIEELSKSMGQLKAELAAEQAKAINLGLELNAANEHNTQLKTHAQGLQNEWDAAKQRIEELSKSTGQLETELAVEQTKAINLALELNAANEHNTQLQAHAKWLQNEWDAASAKVLELSHSSHHWRTVADQLNKEKQIIYTSKFWRFTWPVRKIMQVTKWTLVLPARTVRWTLRLPKRIAGRNMASTTSHSCRTDSAPQKPVAAACLPIMSEESKNNLSPRAGHIYAELRKAIEARKN